MNDPAPSLTRLRMTSPNSVRIGAGASLFKPSVVAVAAEGSRGTVLLACMPLISCSFLSPGVLLQYSRSTYWMIPIGMLLIMRVKRATRIVNMGSTGGGRRVQEEVSALKMHRDLPDCTVDGSLRQLA